MSENTILGAIVAVLVALFGWLKQRDNSRLKALEDKVEDQKTALEDCHKHSAACVEERAGLKAAMLALDAKRVELLQEVAQMRALFIKQISP